MTMTLRAPESAECLPGASPWEAGTRVPASVPPLKAVGIRAEGRAPVWRVSFWLVLNRKIGAVLPLAFCDLSKLWHVLTFSRENNDSVGWSGAKRIGIVVHTCHASI